MKKGIKILSYGFCLPEKVLSNNEISELVDTTDQWILERTGIKNRHIAEDQGIAELSYSALKRAVSKSSLKISEIDTIIVATTTQEKVFPSTASLVQQRIGLKKAVSFDINAACSGFVYGFILSMAMINQGIGKNIALIGADVMSKVVNWEDRKTCVLFGDGAGCVILSPAEGYMEPVIYWSGNAEKADILRIDRCSYNMEKIGVFMEGQEVFKEGISRMCESIDTVLRKSGTNIEDIDLIIPHQANRRMIESIATKLGVANEKVASTIEFHANTSAASIPLALSKYIEEGKLNRGSKIILTSFGAGMVWGAVLLEF